MLNLTVAIIQTLLCIAAIVAISLKSEDKNDLLISSRDLQVNNQITTYATYNSDVILGLLIAFTAVTALFHYAYTLNLWGYSDKIKKKNNSLRWIEYSITATIMIVVISLSSGTVELNAQVLIAVMIACSMLLGDIIEKTMGTKVAITATIAAWLLVLSAWAIIIKNYEFAAGGFTLPECDKKISPPSFVAYLIIILVVFYLSFGFVQLYQICRPKTNYKHIEKTYSILSVLSKTALVSIILWGVLARSQAIDPCATEDDNNTIPFPIKESHYNSKYRLGDMVMENRYQYNKDGYSAHTKKFPDSIATQYLNLVRNLAPKERINNLDVLDQIIKNGFQQYKNKDSSCIVFHCRTGDVIDGQNYSVREFLAKPRSWTPSTFGRVYVKPLKYYEEILDKIKNIPNHPTKLIFTTGFHTGHTPTKSIAYVNEIVEYFKSHGFDTVTRIGGPADEDFVFMSTSKYFVPSGGNFSKVIANMVRYYNGTVIDA